VHDFEIVEIPDTDWVAQVQRELVPVEAGRFFVYGSHDADKLPEGRVGLLIEAAMAFGTGHHATTLGCLQALDTLAEVEKPVRIADIGSGTAVLAMGAKRVWPDAVVIASDIDDVAVAVAEANCQANDLASITCIEAAGFDHPLLKEGQFDLVFANILKGPLIELAPDMKAATRPGGVLILSGLLQRQVDDVLSHYVANDFTLEDRRDIGEWSALVLRAKA
jgi:ribosomal protein L11 methyltransferase